VEEAKELANLSNVKKLNAPGSFFRIRIGDYRIGICLDGDTVEFVRVLPRRDLYRYFP
jgi:mRNA interferase RelE/StbE